MAWKNELIREHHCKIAFKQKMLMRAGNKSYQRKPFRSKSRRARRIMTPNCFITFYKKKPSLLITHLHFQRVYFSFLGKVDFIGTFLFA